MLRRILCGGIPRPRLQRGGLAVLGAGLPRDLLEAGSGCVRATERRIEKAARTRRVRGRGGLGLANFNKCALRTRVVLSRIVRRLRARPPDRCKKLATGRQSGRFYAMLVSLLSPTDAWMTSRATAVSCSVQVSATRTT